MSNTETLKAISAELAYLVECEEEVEETGKLESTVLIERQLLPHEFYPVLNARIEASRSRLRVLGFVAPAHPGDTAKVKLA